MARIRTIKPDFWTDEKLTECSLSARLLFIGTWNFADDNGNLDRSHKQIKARVFPLDDINCEPLINELLTQGLLIEYSVNDKLFLHIQGFTKHQLINRPSKPTCPEYNESLKIVKHSVSTHTALITEGKGKERKVRKGKIHISESYDSYPDFLEFWSIYPRTDDKRKALEAWIKVSPPIQKVLQALEWQIPIYNELDIKFVPMPTTYINKARWEDEPPRQKMENPF